MKKSYFLTRIFILIGIIAVSVSCKKDAENVIDCLFEGAHFKTSANVTDKLVDFRLQYTGDHSLKSVVWDFGDGNKQTTTSSTDVDGTITVTISHTYTNAGTKNVKVSPTLTNGPNECTLDLTKTVTIN